MYREMKKADLTLVNGMLGRINSSAKKVFNQAYEDGNLVSCLMYDDKNDRGVFTIVEGPNYYALQVSFDKDVSNYKVIKVIHEGLDKIIKVRGSKDIYLNINGYNPSIINYFRNYNFTQDSLGFEYSFSTSSETIDAISNFKVEEGLTFKGFEEENAHNYIELLDDAFRQLDIDSNEEQDRYRKSGQKFLSWLRKVDEKKNFGALWSNVDLVGVYILNDDCIHTIAVNPKYEGKGFGNQIMKYCLKNLILNKKYKEVYLQVLFENKRAQKFYIKNGFEVRGYYCENTYVSKM
ncbi:GNAT family N-acetyltransferase [Mycoplasmatota bacterium]|nr:GNAT family N-acetyltransferase [Mycoplasmatota bacterium]